MEAVVLASRIKCRLLVVNSRRLITPERFFRSCAGLFAGHSHWANIKRDKAVNDAHRAKEFSKISKAITSAVRRGGREASNADLVAALSKAKEINFPKDKIELAIAKGAGTGDKTHEEEVTYEGFGPHGVAFLVQGLTPSRNRTAATLRHAFDKHEGRLVASGSVQRNFLHRGQIVSSRNGMSDDALMEVALEAGAEDYEAGSGDHRDDVVFWCPRTELLKMKAQLEARGLACRSVDFSVTPSNYVELDDESYEAVQQLVDTLEDNEDIQHVHHNARRDS
eukprot:TRINITY_DN5334_c1_g2_i1.p1 TRINITY_DN5334_c1_g2~~TRINITY_DN5334_c1_g2_i1.p1  ORF type:complete len:280 (+),score=61.98 TRINITY_DN5334_c1_g2_i1:121-960(+)